MALHNRVEYGFNGYQVPPTPRAARSARKRCLIKRNGNGKKQMCAFEVLATLAGILSDEKLPHHEDSSGDEEKEKSSSDGNSCIERNFMFTDFLSENSHQNFNKDGASRPASGLTSPNSSDECKLQLGISVPSLEPEPEPESGKQIKTDEENCRNLSMMSLKAAASCSRDKGVLEKWSKKSSDLVSSFDTLKLVNDDYDVTDGDKAFNKAPHRDGHHRIRTVTSSKHCKESADTKENNQPYNNPDKERCNGKNFLKEQRPLRDFPIKKRKLYDCSSVYNHEERNCTIGVVNGSTPTMTGASTDQTPAAGGSNASLHSRNQQVKLRIKSFRVPELYIEIPETASVGCLKRAVMEAVNEVLGGGLRVGVLLQGKKIREDSKSLLQTGISHSNRVDNLVFCLEPNNFPTQTNTCHHKDHPRQLFHNSPQPPLAARYPPTLGISPNGLQRNHHHQQQQGNLDSPRSNITGNSLKSFTETVRDSAPSLEIVTSQKNSPESKAIVPLQITRPGAALSVMPLRKYKRSESVAQRRIRRPFTVAEVEALVQAVEKLGTGRWRDVKLRAFDHSKHRTYVDLKDKWKTLVHTARISPQQRRGEPVPQELLDRVLTAHAYWSQQQAKQQLKSQNDIYLLR